MDSDSLLQLLDVLGTALTESRLGLSVPLLALLGGGVYLSRKVSDCLPGTVSPAGVTYWLAASLALGLLGMFLVGRSGVGLGGRLHGVHRSLSHVFFLVDRHLLVHC